VPSWSVLALELPVAHADELVGCLAAHSLGAEIVDTIGGECRVRIYLRSTSLTEQAFELACGVLRGAGLEAWQWRLRTERLADEGWTERYQASLQPFDLGQKFVVFPGGRRQETGNRSPIVLVPSRAFGTGEHPTTRMCTEGLESRVREGSRWLDLGCGSGILSIVAWCCGAGEVLAVDHDAEAVDVARGVLRTNRLSGRIAVRRGSAADCPDGHWDGIVANISAAFFHEQADRLPGLLTSGGTLLASGFLVEELSAIADRLARRGLVESGRRVDGPWALLIATREDRSPSQRKA
jgi:ribosomal protein L11 methyltransferase